jgi:hypothetical protein
MNKFFPTNPVESIFIIFMDTDILGYVTQESIAQELIKQISTLYSSRYKHQHTDCEIISHSSSPSNILLKCILPGWIYNTEEIHTVHYQKIPRIHRIKDFNLTLPHKETPLKRSILQRIRNLKK